MYLISKIIAKQWLQSIVGAITILFMLITVGDIINGFLQGYEVRRIFLQYALKMPDLMGKMLPICSLLATLFTFNKLKAHSELIAILASGFKANSIYILIAKCSLVIFLIQLINLGFIMPQANLIKRSEFEKSRKNESKYLAKSKIGKDGIIWYRSKSYFASFSFFNKETNTISDYTQYRISSEGILKEFFKAKSVRYIEEKKWLLSGYTNIQDINMRDFSNTKDQEEVIVKLEEDPSNFVQFDADLTTLNILDLYKFIKKIDKSGINASEYKVMLYEKLSLSFICIVFALIPLATIYNPNRRSSSFGKSIVLTLVFTIGFWLAYSATLTLGKNSTLYPSFATFLIPILSALYVLYTLRKNQSLK